MISEVRFSRRGIRADGAGKGRSISGYAAVFDQVADVGGAFLEVIRAGAFGRAVREKQDVRCLLNHDPNMVLGRVANDTLELREDAKGLWFRCVIGATGFGDDALAMIRRGDVGECSFGFTAIKQTWSAATDAAGVWRELRELQDVDLFDVSPVTYPAYDKTEVGVDDRSRMPLMFPLGAPPSAPLELRARISHAIDISTPEHLERIRARGQAERLLADASVDEHAARCQAYAANLLASL